MFVAKQRFVHGVGPKETHVTLEPGAVFECDEEYAKEHLLPHGLAELHKAKAPADKVVLPTVDEVPAVAPSSDIPLTAPGLPVKKGKK